MRRAVLTHSHRLGQRIDPTPVVLDLLYLVPWEASRIPHRLLDSRCRIAIRHDLEPVAVPPVFGDASLVRGEEHVARRVADALDLDLVQLARAEVEAGQVTAASS